MKKVTLYEDNDGHNWKTEHEALMSDYRIALQPVFNDYAIASDDFDLDEWMEKVKNDPKLIDALLHVLEIDDTKIAVERIAKSYERRKNETSI